jgi:hypothetical protein
MENQITNPVLSQTLLDILKGENPGEVFLGRLIGNLITLLLIVATVATIFLLIIGGIQWMTSGGDKAAIEAARGRITAALVGLILVFITWAIILLIEQFLGITIIGGPITLPTL